jgi:hypothetical protein
MPELFVERTFESPLTPDDVLATATDARSCFQLHRVDWRVSLLAAGGRKMVCRFHAPDAESLRIALRASGAPARRLWPGTVHDGPNLSAADQASANVAIERSFEVPVAVEEIQAAEENGWCAQAYNVTFLRTYVSSDRKRMICLYRAPDAEAVRMAQRYMKMPVEAIWAFTAVRPGAAPSQTGAEP